MTAARATRGHKWLLGSAGLFGLVLTWYVVTTLGLVPRAFLPSPLATWNALVRGFTTGEMAAQLAGTVGRMIQGWLLASLVAIAIGSLIGVSPLAREHIRPTLGFLRALPASATIPIAIALVGLSPAMVVGVVTFGSIWPTLLATVQGFAMVEPRLHEVARALGLSRLAFIWKIGMPNALPDILTGMRLSLTVALILSVIGEMLAAQQGLGQAILLSARSFRAPDLYAGILLLGLVGALSTALLAQVERRLIRWR
jgi:ABC-type nitrate/sulfonate/bicarbonate transport system permease component